MESLKIVQIIQKPQFRGAELFACQLSNHLISKGHDVLMVCLYKGDVELPFKGPIINLQRPESKRFFDITGWKKFKNIVAGFQPDIIQANAADTLKFVASSSFLYNINVPIIYRNANKIGDFMQFPLKKMLNKLYLSQVSFVLSVSKLCRKDFVQTFNFPRNKIKTIQIGVELDNYSGTVFNLNNFKNKKVLVHVGSFVPEKNHIGLIKIFAQLSTLHPNAVLLLIGKGYLEEQIYKFVKELNLEEKVFFMGCRRDVMNILKNSDCLLLPSLVEGLPGVLLEAMYCRLPIVAYNVGGISEIINENTGSLIEKNDEVDFVNQVNCILRSKNKTIIKNAYLLVQKKYINYSIAHKFEKSYQKLIVAKNRKKLSVLG